MSPQAAPNVVEPEVESPEKRALRVTRIKAMIQQASSKQGDGQLAAWQACALIRKFGLDIVDPTLVDTLHKEIHGLKAELEAAKAGFDDGPAVNPGVVGGLGWAQTAQVQQFWTQQPQGPAPAPAANPNWFAQTHQPAPPVAPPPVVPPPVSPMTAPVYIASSKFAGRCKHCGKTLDVGDPVRWQKSVGVWCPTTSCYSDWLNNQHQAAAFTSPFTP